MDLSDRELTLREKIRRDFGVDLSIGSGQGNKANPLEILVPEKGPNDYVSTMYTFADLMLHAIFDPTKIRFLENRLMDWPDNRIIDTLAYEVVYETEDQIVTETRRFYFDITAPWTKRSEDRKAASR